MSNRIRCECLYCGHSWLQSPILWSPDTEVCTVCRESQNIKVRKEPNRSDVFGYNYKPKRRGKHEQFED